MRGNIWVHLMNGLLILFIVLLAIALLTLPFLVDKYAEMTGEHIPNTLCLKVFLYLTAIPFMVLLVMTKKLCKNILHQDPFSQSSITALHVISVCAFIDFLLYAVGTMTILKNLLSLTLMVAAFMVGLVSLILSHLFKVMMEIKQENDLTI
jgi:hypothetical protein